MEASPETGDFRQFPANFREAQKSSLYTDSTPILRQTDQEHDLRLPASTESTETPRNWKSGQEPPSKPTKLKLSGELRFP